MMTPKSWLFAGIALLAGLFLGYMFAPPCTPAHNKIAILVEDTTNKLNIAPAKGDTIRWINQANGKDIGVTFSTDSPCQPTNPPDKTCTIEAAKGHFQYDCADGVTCEDPGIDPRNQDLVAPGPINGFKIDVYKMLGSKNYPDTSSETAPVPPGENMAGVPSPSEGTLPPPADGNAAKASDYVIASISCQNKAPVVTWGRQGSAVHAGETILWKGGSYNFKVDDFTTKGVAVQLCDPATPPIDQSNYTCIVKQDSSQTLLPYTVAYTVTIDGCGSASPTVPPLTVNSPPKH